MSTMRRGLSILSALPGLAVKALSISVLVVGCYGGGMIERDALAYNQALSSFWNQQLFLNIVRASERAPMYFTAVTTVQQGYTVNSSFEPKLFLENFRDKAEALLKMGVSGGPTMVMGTLDSDKFMKGFLHPVDLDVFKLYLDLGWPKEMLLLLFVRTLELKLPAAENMAADAKGKKEVEELRAAFGFEEKTTEVTYEGALDEHVGGGPTDDIPPQNAEEALKKLYPTFLKYRDVMRALARMLEEKKAKLIFETEADNIGPALLEADAKKPEFLALAQKDGFSINFDKKENKYQLQRAKKGARIVFQSLEGTPVVVAGVIKVRSPEAILYHLGEIVRFCDKWNAAPVKVYGKKLDEPKLPLFFARRRKSEDDPLLSVTFRNNEYVIPKEGSGASNHVLELASQLVMIYKSSEGLPTGGVYTLISR